MSLDEERIHFLSYFPDEFTEYYNRDYKLIDKYLKSSVVKHRANCCVNPELNRIRLRMWFFYGEVDLDHSRETKISYSELCAGLCSVEFLKKSIAIPMRFSWLLRPIASIDTVTEEGLETAYNRIREILALPLYNIDGLVDRAVVGAILKATELLSREVNSKSGNGGFIRRSLKALPAPESSKGIPSQEVTYLDSIDPMKALDARLSNYNLSDNTKEAVAEGLTKSFLSGGALDPSEDIEGSLNE